MNSGSLRRFNETERPKDATPHWRSKQAGRKSGEAGWTFQEGRGAPGQCVGPEARESLSPSAWGNWLELRLFASTAVLAPIRCGWARAAKQRRVRSQFLR